MVFDSKSKLSGVWRVGFLVGPAHSFASQSVLKLIKPREHLGKRVSDVLERIEIILVPIASRLQLVQRH